jgi:competence protein ComEA
MRRDFILILFGLLIGLLIGGLIFLISKQPQGQPLLLSVPPTPGPMTVYITGAVQSPGVYKVARNSRVQDLVQLAGGLAINADPNQVNLAARLNDGEKIVVIELKPTALPVISKTVSGTPITPAKTTPTIQFPLNINLADAQQLDALPGIGEVKAKDIIAYRDLHGPFARLEDLMRVPGINTNLFNRLKEYITID